MRNLRWAIAFAIAIGAGAARAEGSQPGGYGPPVHQGMYLHFDIGAGQMQTKGGGLTVKGSGFSWALALGASVSPAWVLGGEVWGINAVNPKVHDDFGNSGTVDGSVMFGIGPTVRLYLAPETVDMYVAVTPSLTQVSVSDEGATGDSEMGFGARLALGKEWKPSGSRWGYGVGAHVAFSSNSDQGGNAATLSSVGGGISFSITMN